MSWPLPAGRSTLSQVAWLLVTAIALLLLVAGVLLRTQGIAGGIAQVAPLVLAQQRLLERWLALVPAATARADPLLHAIGLQLQSAPPAGPDSSGYPFPRAIAAHLRAQLGADRVRLQEGPPPRLWLALEAPQGRLWMAVELPMQMDRVRDSALLWLAGAALVIGVTATRIAGRLTRPLRALAAQAPALVRGDAPPVAPGQGLPDEVQALAQALAAAGAAQRRAVRERDLMLAGLSHDLRSPLARLRFAIELGDHGGGGEDHAGRLAMVNDLEELDALLGQFIAFARGGTEALEGVAEIDLQALQAALQTSRRRPADWRWAMDPALAGVYAPPLGLRRAIGNLLDNAERHGAPPFVCALEAVAAKDLLTTPRWRVRVRDHGPGLSPARVDALRQPFQRGDPARGGPGSGLGLAIVDRFALSQCGVLCLGLPDDGQGGLCATLELPLSAANGVDPQSTAALPRP